MRSVNVAKESEPTSPDSVLDLRAGHKRKRTEQQTQDLQLLRHKIQAECSQVRVFTFLSCGNDSVFSDQVCAANRHWLIYVSPLEGDKTEGSQLSNS